MKSKRCGALWSVPVMAALAFLGCSATFNEDEAEPVFTVTFNAQGGSALSSQTVIAGSQIDRPVDPSKAGFVFDNWYDAAAAASGSVITWPLMVNSDITLYAHWISEEVPFCTVTFNAAGGTVFVPQRVIAGSQINQPANPVKEGFAFDNWYDAPAAAGGSVIAWPLTVNGDMTLYAQWITEGARITQCTVTFNTAGGSVFVPQMVIAGSQINRPANPSKAGFIFDNWYDAAAAASGSVIAWPLTVDGDITLYAQWTPENTGVTQYTVTFNTAGGSVFVPQTVITGSQINRPANPVKEGFVFDNWYDAPAAVGGSVIAWPMAVNSDITLYAYWITAEVPLYTVTFNTRGGSPFVPQTVIAGSQINRPANPAKAGFAFDDWYDAETAAGGGVIAWPLTVNRSLTVYAHWISKHTVSFMTQGGSSGDSFVMVNAGGTLNRVADPVREGYVFKGWYDAGTGGEAIEWPLTVDEDITVYAQWVLLGQGSLEVTFSGLPQDESTGFTGTVNTLSWRTGTLNIGVPAASFPEASFQWYLDGSPLDGATAEAISKQGSDFTPGRHDVTVRITTADNKVYSKTIRFTVTQ